MSFLDRFKPQPRWKHQDASVRLAAIRELPGDEDEVLLDLASTDEDVRVRRAAGGRLRDVAALVRLARSERDVELRRELAERLVAVATAGADDDGDAALALEGLEDERHLAAVARSSPFETVRAAALGRVHGTKALGGVARNTAHADTAAAATARVADRQELVQIALRTDHRDAGLMALERAAEAALAEDTAAVAELLESVAERAKNKSVAKRARGMMQAIEEAAAARRAALEAWQQQIASLVARVEALAASPAEGGEDALVSAEAEWAALAGPEGASVDEETASRFEAACSAARDALAVRARQEAERQAAEQARAAARERRDAIVAHVSGLDGEDLPEQLAAARAAWTEAAGDEDPQLLSEFTALCERALQRQQDRRDMADIHARLAALAADAERIAVAEDAPEPAAWQAVASEWAALQPRAEGLDPAVAAAFDAASARVREREAEREAAAERAMRQQLQRAEQLVERAQKRAGAEDLTLREAERLVRDIKAALEAPPADQALVERLRSASAALAPRLHELREMDEWKRFANAAVQEELIARVEALRAKGGFDTPEGPSDEELEKAARELHDIQERWKTVAEAPRAQAQALWHRYRQAADPVQTRLREFFARRNEARQGNLEKKLALIERAEALADSTDWIRTAEEMKKLQAEWQQVGPVPRQEARATWKRFREACDRFFSRRNADLAERKETWSANLAKKEALCERAEALAASTDWDAAASEIRRLQTEWKAVGPVRRNRSEAVWQRFRTACDAFFERYRRRDEIALEARHADREALVTELEALGSTEGAQAGALLEQVRSLRSRWNASAPVVAHGADPLSARFLAALEGLLAANPDAFRGTELDVDANRQKMEKLIARVEAHLVEMPAPARSSSQALADMLREALAANTIGGRAGDESRWKTMADDVRQAQAAWGRLGPVPGEAGRALAERFHRATSKFFDLYRRKVSAPQGSPRVKVGTR